jgi:glutaredoxin
MPNFKFKHNINKLLVDIYLDYLMDEKILFSLEKCDKCNQIKELLKERNDIRIITYPHEIINWNENQLNQAKSYGVFDDLLITAPIMLANGKKLVGYLRIRKWLQDNK